ncbi:hypothetical protein TNCV_4119671 [Trichonephila clavipes]|nr:hypothetical protein TNCV_4119671 [Trichonephila clavipes]
MYVVRGEKTSLGRSNMMCIACTLLRLIASVDSAGDEESPGSRGLEKSRGWNGRGENSGSRKLEESAKERDLVRDWSGKEGKTMKAGGVGELE